MIIKTFKPLLGLFLCFICITSCRTEDDLAIDPPFEETINANSTIADLVRRTSQNDGSPDNIIDNASCLSVQLPVKVTVNEIEITIDDEDGYEEIEDIIDLFDDDLDAVVISYPITIILADFSTVAVNSDSELTALAANCVEANEDDDDIECIDFQYPIAASIFDENNNLINTITINNDNDIYDFIEDLDEFAAVTISFPITVILADGTTQNINTIQELEDAIEMADNSCDEDDDYDFNDDDCDNCTTNQLADLLTGCTDWTLDKLERNDQDLEDNYSGYQFNFATDGTLTVANNSNNFSGTWESNGSGNSIAVTINIPNLGDFNAIWQLHEIEQNGENKVDLRLGEDRLRFESNCSSGGNGGGGDGSGNTGNLASVLVDGLWVVGSYTEDADDQTSNYNGYTFNFNSDGTAIANNGSTTNGTWSPQNSDSELFLNFGTVAPLDEFDDTWDVISITDTQVELRDVSGGDGGTDTLIFNKQ